MAGASPALLGLERDRGLAVAPGLFPEDCATALDRSGADGNLFSGFIAGSADKIFESTDFYNK